MSPSHTRRASLAATLCAVIAVLVTALPTVARAAPGTSGSGHAPYDGANWSGYVTTDPPAWRMSVTAYWKQPSAECLSARDRYSAWVGIDGYTNQTVERVGVRTDCATGQPRYRAWYQMYPGDRVWLDPGRYPVSAGDSVEVWMTYLHRSDEYHVTLNNNTADWRYETYVQTPVSQNASAEVVVESPNHMYPDFGKLDFTAVLADSWVIGAAHPTPVTESDGVAETRTGSLTDLGTAFSVSWLHE